MDVHARLARVRSAEGEPEVRSLPTAAAGGEPALPSSAERGRVMVVDDEPSIGSTIRRCLRSHEVVVFTDAREALERLAGEQFDVILCDLNMPGMSGDQFYRELARCDPRQAAQVTFLTGGSCDEDLPSLAQVPRLEKPFEPRQLREEIAARVAAHRAGSRSIAG